MIDLLLLLGIALCMASVVMAIVSVIRTHAPRSAAIVLVLGVAMLFLGAWGSDAPFGLTSVRGALDRMISGESFGTNTVSAPPPSAVTQAAQSGQ